MVHDLNSKWPEICPISHTETSRIIEFLEDLFVHWGLPSTIVTDNGPQLFQDNLSHFLKESYSAYTNIIIPSTSKRWNREVQPSCETRSENTLVIEGRSFPEAIRRILINYRATPHALTRRSPAEVMINRGFCLPLHTILPPQVNDKDSVNGDMEEENATLRETTEDTTTRIRQ